METATERAERLASQKYLTIAEAAEYARTRVQTVYWWIKRGLIVSMKPPKARQVVRRTDVEGLMKLHRVTP